MAGSGRAAEFGILFKGGEHLEMTHRITTVVLDKTGTVTNGTPVLTDVFTNESIAEEEFLSLVASAEKQSEHPLAQAIVQGINEKGIPLKNVTEFEAIPGFGIKAMVDGKELLVGTRKLMNKYNVQVAAALAQMDEMERVGKTAMLTAINGQYAGTVAVADTIKETSKMAISRLKNMGLDVIMITGDNQQTAELLQNKQVLIM